MPGCSDSGKLGPPGNRLQALHHRAGARVVDDFGERLVAVAACCLLLTAGVEVEESWRARREAARRAWDGYPAASGWGAPGVAACLPADGEGHRPAGGGNVRLWPARLLVEGAPTGRSEEHTS